MIDNSPLEGWTAKPDGVELFMRENNNVQLFSIT